MADESLIPDEAKAMIGMEGPSETGYAVTERDIRRYCYAVDDSNPLFTDGEIAKEGQWEGIIAPPLFFDIPFDKSMPLDRHREDGIGQREKDSLSPPLRVSRAMAGGSEIEFFEPIRPGDVLTKKSRLANVYERVGRSGPMVMTVRETTYHNQRGEIVVVVRGTGITR